MGDNGAYMHTNKLRDTPTGASDNLCPFSLLTLLLALFFLLSGASGGGRQ